MTESRRSAEEGRVRNHVNAYDLDMVEGRVRAIRALARLRCVHRVPFKMLCVTPTIA